ncbi:scoloptoxin SSD20-like [Haemaphysalis longicornis]
MNHTLKQAIDAGRLHNQLIPDNVVKHENFTDNDVVGQLSARGHKLATVHWKGDVVALLRTHPQAYSAYHDFRSGVPGGMGGG